MSPFESVEHQTLIDGLGYHVLRDEMPKWKAEEIIEHYQDNHPESDMLDEAILAEVRKDWGLSAPTKCWCCEQVTVAWDCGLCVNCYCFADKLQEQIGDRRVVSETEIVNTWRRTKAIERRLVHCP